MVQASTNAVVAAACANEAFKLVTSCGCYLDNNLMYIGDGGLNAPTFAYEREPECVVCGGSLLLRAQCARESACDRPNRHRAREGPLSL